MPGRRGRDQPVDPSLCRRCQTAAPEVTVRTEPLCKPCFGKYVNTKVVKRMESFRVRHAEPGRERTLLLPLSLGTCSISLLHILSHHLQGQAEKTGRTGFRLSVVYVANELPVSGSPLSSLSAVQDRYPAHEYRMLRLADALRVRGLPASITDLVGEPGQDSGLDFTRLLDALQSNTARADVAQLLRRRLIVEHARSSSCEAILWGDSTTRLAERTLAETAKGRGQALPWVVADGDSPVNIPFFYPLREILSKELEAFTTVVEPSLGAMVLRDAIKPAVSTKDTTIDDLMHEYFQSVERDYPSIVANVVRTASKLLAVPVHEVELRCELCEMPLAGAAPEQSRLCYGCIRTLPLAND